MAAPSFDAVRDELSAGTARQTTIYRSMSPAVSISQESIRVIQNLVDTLFFYIYNRAKGCFL